MSWLRRREETLNEKLVSESGYSPEGAAAAVADEQPESEPEPLVGSGAPSSRSVSAMRGIGSGANRWAWEPPVVATVELPELEGEEYAFTTLPDGSVIVEDVNWWFDRAALAAMPGSCA